MLRPKGILYSDHDMDAAFHHRFRWPLTVYRQGRNAKAKYRKACASITDEVYELTEWHEKGLDGLCVKRLLEANGFLVDCRFHWFGLTALSDCLLGTKPRTRGWAPLLSLTAIKGGRL